MLNKIKYFTQCCFEIVIKFVAERFINCNNHKIFTHKLKIRKKKIIVIINKKMITRLLKSFIILKIFSIHLNKCAL